MRRSIRLPHRPESVPAARRFVADVLADVPPETVGTVALAVSELVTNVLVHTDSAFELTVDRPAGGERIRVEVADGGAGRPTVQSPGPLDLHGRGLRIIEAFASRWGTEEHPDTRRKTVWFELGSRPSARSAPSR